MYFPDDIQHLDALSARLDGWLQLALHGRSASMI
jgi:hypothetical protein